MDILKNIQWFLLTEPSTAVYKDTYKQISKKDLNTIIFPENVNLSLLLNDNYLFFVSRKLNGPVTILQLFKFINDFYQEPLTEDINKAFQENDLWLEEILSEKDNGVKDLINFDVFSLNVDPDFCGLEYDESNNEWIVHIGPE